MTVAIIWILAQMGAPWWVVTCVVLERAAAFALGVLKSLAENEVRE